MIVSSIPSPSTLQLTSDDDPHVIAAIYANPDPVPFEVFRYVSNKRGAGQPWVICGKIEVSVARPIEISKVMIHSRGNATWWVSSFVVDEAGVLLRDESKADNMVTRRTADGTFVARAKITLCVSLSGAPNRELANLMLASPAVTILGLASHACDCFGSVTGVQWQCGIAKFRSYGPTKSRPRRV